MTDMAADMEVDNVTDKVADKKMKLMYARKQSVLGQSCLMRSVPDLRVLCNQA